MDLITIVVLVIIVVVILGFILWFIGIYNRFMNLRNASESTLGQIKVAMKKRLDMIEQLLGAVKSYAKFEQETLTKITSMRTAVATGGVSDVNAVDKESRALIGNLFAVAEAYPNLKTSETVTSLMTSINGMETEIARQRYTFNNIAQQLNTMVDTIPSNFVAMIAGIRKLDYLEFEEEIKKAPKIEF